MGLHMSPYVRAPYACITSCNMESHTIKHCDCLLFSVPPHLLMQMKHTIVAIALAISRLVFLLCFCFVLVY